jgi:hypothetical protein
MELKKIAIITVSVVCIIVFVILVGFCVYNLYHTLASSWGISGSDNTPDIYADCNAYADNNELIVHIENYDKEIKDVKCELASKGGMTADKDQVSLPLISPNSTDICNFILTGKQSNSLIVRVTYSKKSFWGNKSFSTIAEAECYSNSDYSNPPDSTLPTE